MSENGGAVDYTWCVNSSALTPHRCGHSITATRQAHAWLALLLCSCVVFIQSVKTQCVGSNLLTPAHPPTHPQPPPPKHTCACATAPATAVHYTGLVVRLPAAPQHNTSELHNGSHCAQSHPMPPLPTPIQATHNWQQLSHLQPTRVCGKYTLLSNTFIIPQHHAHHHNPQPSQPNLPQSFSKKKVKSLAPLPTTPTLSPNQSTKPAHAALHKDAARQL